MPSTLSYTDSKDLSSSYSPMLTCALIPTYNNVQTAADVVRRTLAYLPVIVVCDGPTDGTFQSLQAISDVRLTIVYYPQNRGKGYALKQGFRKAQELGFTHVLTLDSDGQHYPEDIPLLLRMSAIRPEAIIVGSRGLKQTNMPGKNTFANKFSNFWFAVQTWHRLPDTQTGFRIYPLHALHGLNLMTHRYEAELLLLVFSAWADTPLIPVPIRVYYPPREQRVSYFRPARDFTRISLLNTLLCCLAIVYGLPRRMWRTVYYSLFFAFFALAMNLTALALRVRYGHKPKFEERLRSIVSRSVRWFLHRLPGTRFEVLQTNDAKQAPQLLSASQVAQVMASLPPSIIIANHQSLLDVLSLIALSPNISMVAKGWVRKNPIFGHLTHLMGMISVAEHDYESLVTVIRQEKQKGRSVVIFPEGTRSLYGELLRFHRGAFYVAEQLQLPILPIVLHGQGEAHSKKPFHVGHPARMAVTLLPSVAPSDPRFGTDYRERTKRFHDYYKQLITQF